MKFIVLFGLWTLFCLNISCHYSSKKTEIQDDSAYLNKMFEEGKMIFKLDCNACHGWKEKTDNNLRDIVNRLGTSYLETYITKQDSLIKVKDKYAILVKEEYGNAGNSHNFIYSHYQLKCLMEYLKK